MRGATRGIAMTIASDPRGEQRGDGIDRRCRTRELAHTREELARIARDVQTEKILDLRRCDQEGDAVGEPDDDRSRDEGHRVAEVRQSEHDQDDAGHHRHHQQTGEAEAGDDAGNDHDERAGRSRDLQARAAQQRDDEAAGDRGVDAGLRRDAGRDPERHRKGKRDEADRHARDAIAAQALRRVVAQGIEDRGTPARHRYQPSLPGTPLIGPVKREVTQPP
jgi:hypothetical protein